MARLVEPEWGVLGGTESLTPEQVEGQAQSLLGRMTLDEKIGQMTGDVPFLPGILGMARGYNTRPYLAGENLRLGIPGIRFSDGPRGVVIYCSTCFPVSMARGASWDVELEERIGEAMGIEARAQGANFFAGVCINLLRHPAWGRAQETYGEDPYHLGELGAALVRGVQRHVMACIKHYACNSIEKNRFKVDVQVDERTLREIYLPHFKRCVDEGAAAVMTAYNRVNGEYCSQNRHLLTEILKNEWGFAGMIVSDFVFGVSDGRAAALAGLDIELPFPRYYGKKLKKLVQRDEVPREIIDAAVLRILRQKIRFARTGEPGHYGKENVACQDHRDLARLSAESSAVLLKNDPVKGKPLLPLDLIREGPVAVLGRLAATPNTGDAGSSQVRPPYVVTPLEGLRRKVPELDIRYSPGQDLDKAAALARSARLAVLVVGYTQANEGEYLTSAPFVMRGKGNDRLSLRLSPHDEALILAVAAANPRTLVVLQGGSAIIMEAWREQVPAILMQWYAGMEGGTALANLLTGMANPSGKLPIVFPRSEEQLPFFDREADEIAYDYYHGYRQMDKQGEEPAFAFGYGLSYTTFSIDELRIENERVPAGGVLRACVDVRNTGWRAGAEVVQLYMGCADSAYDRPVKELKGFRKVTLQPGETRPVEFELPASRLAVWDGGWVIEPGPYRIWVGSSSRKEDLLEGGFEVIT